MVATRQPDILKAVQLLQAPTRQAIARFTGLSPASVTAYLVGLRERGLVVAAGTSPSDGGRPSVVYRLSPTLGCTIGVFFETSVCQLVAVDLPGVVLAERSLPISLAAHPADRVVELIAAEVRELRRDPRVSAHRTLAVGVAAPGMVDTRRGLWLHGLRLSGVEHVDLGSRLQAEIGSPVLLEDEARCLAHLAASRMGRDVAGDLLLIYLGSGVGAGLVLGGELYRGDRGMAGEVGHLSVEEHGERCPCGNAGCLETVASLPAVLRRFQRRLDEGVVSWLQNPGDGGQKTLSLARIRQAAERNDRLAVATIAEIGRALGDACGKTIMLLNPRTLCIGGPVAELGEYLREPVWARIREQVIPELLHSVRVEYTPFRTGDEALGAALLASHWFWSGLDAGRVAQVFGRATP
jgi:N-acetylglucosamine repressor